MIHLFAYSANHNDQCNRCGGSFLISECSLIVQRTFPGHTAGASSNRPSDSKASYASATQRRNVDPRLLPKRSTTQRIVVVLTCDYSWSLCDWCTCLSECTCAVPSSMSPALKGWRKSSPTISRSQLKLYIGLQNCAFSRMGARAHPQRKLQYVSPSPNVRDVRWCGAALVVSLRKILQSLSHQSIFFFCI